MLFDVTQAYLDAALSGRLVSIAEATHEQADLTLRQVQVGFGRKRHAAEFKVYAGARQSRQPGTANHSSAGQPRCRVPAPQAVAQSARRGRAAADRVARRRAAGAPGAVCRAGIRSRTRAAGRQRAAHGADGRPAARPQRRGRGRDRRAPARDVAAGGAGRTDAQPQPDVDLWPHRVSVRRRACIRPYRLGSRGQRERPDPHRRPPEGRRDGGARRRGAGAGAAAPGAGAGGARHAGGVGRRCWRLEPRGKPRRARCNRRRAPTRLPMSVTGRAFRRSSSCRMRGCCCSRPRPIGRRPPGTCR